MKDKNPFFLKEYAEDEPFCGREEQEKYLAACARNIDHVVLIAPRRTGKTSLIKRVQKTLSREGAVCLYVDFFGVVSVEDIAARLADALFRETRSRDALHKRAMGAMQCFRPAADNSLHAGKGFSAGVELISSKSSGFALLEEVLKSLGVFIHRSAELVHFALDEFQEITTLSQSAKIETLLNEYIHRHAAAYTFIGSRREELRAIFSSRSRSFYQEAVQVELTPIPEKKLADFVAGQFTSHGKICSLEVAGQLVASVHCFPYYVRKLSCCVYDSSENKVTIDDVEEAFQVLLKYEEPFFEGLFLGLAPGQIALLRAIAREPGKSIFAQEFIQRHRLGSIGGAQGAKKKMLHLDIIEFRDGKWRIVDPVFEKWLVRNSLSTY